MIGRRTAVGLTLLCALLFSAIAVQSASAQVGTKSVNTTAFICIKGGDEDFSDSHCDNYVGPGNGKFGHSVIENDVTTEVEVTLEGSAKLNGTLAGAATEITCNKVASAAGKSFLHNVETEGKHTATGTLHVNFTECTVAKPAKCTIQEPITVTANAVGVEGLNGKNEMGVEYVGTGENKNFTELTYANKGAEKCSLNGKTFVVKGSVIATSNVAQGNAHHGATAVYEDANEMETLEIGANKASATGTFTTTMAGGGSPITGTTVT